MKLVEPAHFKSNFLAHSLQISDHPAYSKAFNNFMGYVRKEDATAPGPEPATKVIFRAANDETHGSGSQLGQGDPFAANSLLREAGS